MGGQLGSGRVLVCGKWAWVRRVGPLVRVSRSVRLRLLSSCDLVVLGKLGETRAVWSVGLSCWGLSSSKATGLPYHKLGGNTNIGRAIGVMESACVWEVGLGSENRAPAQVSSSV